MRQNSISPVYLLFELKIMLLTSSKVKSICFQCWNIRIHCVVKLKLIITFGLTKFPKCWKSYNSNPRRKYEIRNYANINRMRFNLNIGWKFNISAPRERTKGGFDVFFFFFSWWKTRKWASNRDSKRKLLHTKKNEITKDKMK